MPYANFYANKISAEIGTTENTITVDALPRDSAGAVITSGRLVLEARNKDKREIIKYTGVSGTTLTGVLRGQGGTAAKVHLKGAIVEMNPTAEDWEEALGVPNDITLRSSEMAGNFVVSDTGVIAQVSGLNGSFSNITYYINGIRYSKTGIPNKTYTASKDTYVFIDTTGTITYTEVEVDATPPALPANSVLVAKVTTGASAITYIADLRPLTVVSSYLPKAGAYRQDGIIFSNGNTKLVFDKIEFNIGDGYNASNGRFTAPRSGFYDVRYTIHANTGASERVFPLIFKNGAEFKWGTSTAFNSTESGSIFSNIIYLKANEYIEFYVWSSGAVSVTTGQWRQYMSITMIP